MIENKQKFNDLNMDRLKELNEKDKLKTTYYNSLSFKDKLKILNDKLKDNHLLRDNIDAIIIIIFFIIYLSSSILTFINPSFAGAHFLNYLCYAFLASLVICAICGFIADADYDELSYKILYIMSSIMSLGMNILISNLVELVVNIYKIYFSDEPRNDINRVEYNFVNYFNRPLYDKHYRIYLLHELINSVELKQIKDKNDDVTEIKLNILDDQKYLTASEIMNSGIEISKKYPNIKEREALNLYLKEHTNRKLNFKQLVTKLIYLEQLTQIDGLEKQFDENLQIIEEKKQYLHEIEEIKNDLKDKQTSKDEINQKQIQSFYQ